MPVYNLIERFGIRKMINESLGSRASQSIYQYDDILIGWFMTIFCHGYRLIKTENSKKNLSLIPGLNICSHDTVGRVLKKLATENTKNENQIRIDKSHPLNKFIINENDKLNDLLVHVTKGVGLLKEGVSYTLDVDATLISSETYEAAVMYKGGRGYMPMVCMIGKMPVYISMRSGKASPASNQRDCIEKCIKLLERHNIKINRVRLDGDGYSVETTGFLHSRDIKFVIGADSKKRSLKMLSETRNWKKSEVKTFNHIWDAEMCSFPFKFSKQETVYRMVVIRVGEKKFIGKKSSKWTLHKGHFYKFVLTNDESKSEYDIFKEYHDRGAIERNFDYLKNDFGWRILPFGRLNENSVYMVMSALANNIYHAVLKVISEKVQKIKQTFRLSRFLREFLLAQFSMKNGNATYYKPEIDYPKLI